MFRRGSVLPLLALLVCVACHHPLLPIAEVHGAPLQQTPGATLDDVADAIWTAASSLGWKPERKAPNVIEATLHVRSHVAVVRIEYDTRTFSIVTLSTENIQRDGDLILSRYNGWIENLRRRICVQSVWHRG